MAFIGKKYPMSSTFTSKVVIQQKVSPVIVVRIVTMRARKGPQERGEKEKWRKGHDKEGGRTSKKEVYREGG